MSFTSGDVATVLSYLSGSWVIGFCAGYVLTKFRDAMNATI